LSLHLNPLIELQCNVSESNEFQTEGAQHRKARSAKCVLVGRDVTAYRAFLYPLRAELAEVIMQYRQLNCCDYSDPQLSDVYISCVP